MKTIWSIFKFVFMDNLRSVWAIAYTLFIALSTYALVYFTGSFTRGVVSIMNIIILITPLVSTMMTSMYFFNKTDFLFLLLAQPIKRSHTFIGMYMGIAVMLALSVGFGLALGMAMSAPRIEDIQVLLLLMLTGVLLSFIFSGLAFLIAIATRDKLRGIGMALSLWLFMAVIYDGLMLMYFIVFSEYPIEEHAIILSLLNPIDLSRIFIMLQLDVSALMGYSGAVFQKFFGTGLGVGVSIGAMLLWIVVPQFLFVYRARRKDF
jgi:Cu-processing system permease protein